VQTTGVLDQGSLPGDRQREEKRVEPRVVEALADVTPGRKHEAFLAFRNRRELLLHSAPRLGAHATLEHDKMAREFLKPGCEVIEMIFPLREEDRRSSLFERLEHVVQNEAVALLVSRSRRVQLLDARCAAIHFRLKLRVTDDEFVRERALGCLALCINREANGAELHIGDGMVTIPALPSCSEPNDVARFNLGKHALERRRRQVVALVDDDLPVVRDQILDLLTAHKALDHRDGELAIGFPEAITSVFPKILVQTCIVHLTKDGRKPK